MKFFKPLGLPALIIPGFFVAASLLDILLVFFRQRFYSNALFITTFGVAGVFAGVLSYVYGMDAYSRKDEKARWTLILFNMALGLLFFFPLAELEGGEYGPAFKAYGVALALSSLFFLKGKPDF